MKDYFDNPDGTASAIDAEGWLHTGDLGSMDRHGYCRVQGRLKDLIIRGGENIYPREIEDLVFTHPAVANAAVVGVPDREWGEVAVAFVQIKAEAAADEAELNAFCRAKLASDRVRGYLKAVSKAGWDLVNWLTHAHGATRADALIAHELTEHILVLFGAAMLRYRQGIPDRCEACGSYHFELWADEPGVPMKPRCCSCGWMKPDPEPAAEAL
jgi:acyl-CoA synthetase (AMP-forming)/AMP-acid ligase II